MEVRWVLKRFAEGGDYQGIFDGTADPLTAHPVQTFELRDLVTQTRLVGPVMRYIMLEVREQMTFHPVMTIEEVLELALEPAPVDMPRAA